jgi:hypothetical protein
MKTELKQIIIELEEVIKEVEYKLTDFEKIDIAVRIYNSQEIKNEFKDYSKTSPLTKKEEPPTQKQIDACKRKGITIPAGATKKEVWKIMNNKEKQNE